MLINFLTDLDKNGKYAGQSKDIIGEVEYYIKNKPQININDGNYCSFPIPCHHDWKDEFCSKSCHFNEQIQISGKECVKIEQLYKGADASITELTHKMFEVIDFLNKESS